MTLAYSALALVLAISAGALLSRWYVTREATRKEIERLRFELQRVTAEYTRLHDSTEPLAEERNDLRAKRDRLAGELAAEKRRGDRLQDRLDEAVGLNTPAIDAGRHWQQNRTDGARKQTQDGGAR